MARGVEATVTDTEGVERPCYHPLGASNLRCNGGIGETRYGLLVGKGSDAVTINDYCLQTPLAEGVGVDQLNHQLVEFTTPQTVGSTCSFTIRRAMINNSGATISGVQEFGAYINFSGSTYYALGFRDVLGTAVDVPDGGAITIEYTVAVTV